MLYVCTALALGCLWAWLSYLASREANADAVARYQAQMLQDCELSVPVNLEERDHKVAKTFQARDQELVDTKYRARSAELTVERLQKERAGMLKALCSAKLALDPIQFELERELENKNPNPAPRESEDV